MGAVFSPGISQYGRSEQRSTLNVPAGDIEERVDLLKAMPNVFI